MFATTDLLIELSY